MSTFQLVSAMNEAFGNAKGNPTAIDWDRVRSQAMNIPDEMGELLIALGADETIVKAYIHTLKRAVVFCNDPVLDDVRDASRDVVVFADGLHHLMGIDADRDMASVVNGVMTRFVKDETDKQATIAKHAAKGVSHVYFEGTYPTMIMKSSVDQPDAPRGKFLKSASYAEPRFYDIVTGL